MTFESRVKRRPLLIFILSAFVFATLSIVSSVGIMLLDRLRKKKNLINDLTLFDGKLILISGINYWFIACIASSMVLFLFKYFFMFYRKKLLKNKNNVHDEKDDTNTALEKKSSQEKKARRARNIFFVTLIGDLLKMMLWPVIISLATTIDFKNMSAGVLAVAISLFVSLVILSHFHHCLSTNVIFGSVFFDDKSERNTAITKKWQYIRCIFFASVVVGSVLAGVRLATPQIFRMLKVSDDWVLGFSNLDILTNCHGFIAVCIVDCVCLILGYVLIDWLSKYIFINYMKDKDLKHNIDEIIFPNHDSQKDAKHVFDLDAIKINFAFLGKYIINDLKLPVESLLLRSLLNSNKEFKENNLLFALRVIFKDSVRVNNLQKEIAKLRSYLKKNCSKEQAKCIDTALKHLESQFLVVKPREKIKNFSKKIILSVASTVAFHVLTQMEGSINKYEIKDWRNILMIGALCVVILILAFGLHLEASQSLVGSHSIFYAQEYISSPCCDVELNSAKHVMNNGENLPAKIKAFEQYNQRLCVRSKGSEKVSEKTNGGSCPCSSLARAKYLSRTGFYLNQKMNYVLA